MKISVVMCTYNGERWVGDQLASILSQSRLPDELVICDDASRDRTLQEIERALDEHSDAASRIDVRITWNETNLGYTQNFAKALSLATGDLTFLSDQDDVWMPNKVEVMCGAFAADPRRPLVYSDAIVVNTQTDQTTRWSDIHARFAEDDRAEHAARFVRYTRVSGFLIAIPSWVREAALPIPEAVEPHDKWIALIAATFGDFTFIPEALVKWRRHGANASPVAWRPDPRRRWRRPRTLPVPTNPFGHLVERLRQLEGRERVDDDKLRLYVQEAAEAKRERSREIDLIEQRNMVRARPLLNRVGAVTRLVLDGTYRRLGGNARTILSDLIA